MVCATTATSARDEAHFKFIRENLWEIVQKGYRYFRHYGRGMLLMWESDFVDKKAPDVEPRHQVSYLQEGTPQFVTLQQWFEEQEMPWATVRDPDHSLLVVIKHSNVGFSAYQIEFAAAVSNYVEVSD
ncbi:MAG: hypothetical protein ACI96M_000396 [Candidatus Azotimanducaceae bacterium]|jgi:hypothetical protein